MTLPRHVAIVMDGNGRWAEARGLPRHAGHKAGAKPVRMAIEECARRRIEALTLFAFSSENWQRPTDEVTGLMALFVDSLDREVSELHANGVRIGFIGDRHRLSVRLQLRIAAAEELTARNSGLKLQVAVSYGGRWDILQAAQKLAAKCSQGALRPQDITEELFSAELELSDVADADLLIRTGGEKRISNFLLWQLAYAELYFCDTLWPEFTREHFDAALEFFASRQRRFGMTAAQSLPWTRSGDGPH